MLARTQPVALVLLKSSTGVALVGRFVVPIRTSDAMTVKAGNLKAQVMKSTQPACGAGHSTFKYTVGFIVTLPSTGQYEPGDDAV